MQWLGFLLALIGCALVGLAVFTWRSQGRYVKSFPTGKVDTSQIDWLKALRDAGWPDVAALVVKTVPWVALVGLVILYAGLRTLEVNLLPG